MSITFWLLVHFEFVLHRCSAFSCVYLPTLSLVNEFTSWNIYWMGHLDYSLYFTCVNLGRHLSLRADILSIIWIYEIDILQTSFQILLFEIKGRGEWSFPLLKYLWPHFSIYNIFSGPRHTHTQFINMNTEVL